MVFRSSARGSQVSYSHEHGYAIMQALIYKGVIGDFRAPDIMRFGFAPLYIGYEDVWRSVEMLKEIMDGDVWQNPAYATRSQVT